MFIILFKPSGNLPTSPPPYAEDNAIGGYPSVDIRVRPIHTGPYFQHTIRHGSNGSGGRSTFLQFLEPNSSLDEFGVGSRYGPVFMAVSSRKCPSKIRCQCHAGKLRIRGASGQAPDEGVLIRYPHILVGVKHFLRGNPARPWPVLERSSGVHLSIHVLLGFPLLGSGAQASQTSPSTGPTSAEHLSSTHTGPQSTFLPPSYVAYRAFKSLCLFQGPTQTLESVRTGQRVHNEKLTQFIDPWNPTARSPSPGTSRSLSFCWPSSSLLRLRGSSTSRCTRYSSRLGSTLSLSYVYAVSGCMFPAPPDHTVLNELLYGYVIDARGSRPPVGLLSYHTILGQCWYEAYSMFSDTKLCVAMSVSIRGHHVRFKFMPGLPTVRSNLHALKFDIPPQATLFAQAASVTLSWSASRSTTPPLFEYVSIPT
ncbi:hypothetical protein C8R46DRAFT_1040670 [Mycena filopes]|nr:hypothetical protein C8R46DRAFT_1040670 [Mycena filopes]